MLLINVTEYDLGSVKLGNVSERQIPITNPTNNTISLNTIGSSCSCTTGTVEKNPLPPNTATVANILFNSGKVGKGDHVKSYSISWFAGGKTYSHTIRFKVNVN
jgi:hypothetical protein